MRLFLKSGASALLLAVFLCGDMAALAVQPEALRTPEPGSSTVRQLLKDSSQSFESQRFTTALSLGSQALAAADAEGDAPGKGLALEAVAQALEALGRADAAAAWSEAALVWERVGNGPRRISTLCSQAIVLLGSQTEAATPVLDHAIALARDETQQPLAAIAALRDAGGRLLALRHLPEATSLLDEALRLGEQYAVDPLFTNRIRFLLTVAEGRPAPPDPTNLHRADVKFSDAKSEDYLAILRLQETRDPNALLTAEILSKLGTDAFLRNDLSRAEFCLVRAWDIARQQRHDVPYDILGSEATPYSVSFAHQLIRTQLGLGKTNVAFRTMEEGRAQNLLDILASRGLGKRVTEPGLWQDYLDAESAYRQTIERRSRAAEDQVRLQKTLRPPAGSAPGVPAAPPSPASLQGPTPDAIANADRERLNARKSMDAKWAAVKRAVPGFAPDAMDVERARTLLPSDALFIAFSVGEKTTDVFLVTSDPRQKVQFYAIEVGESELAQRVSGLTRLLRTPPPAARLRAAQHEKEVVAASREVFSLLFPAWAWNAIDAFQRLMISPDGPLWELPFAALESSGSGPPRWLGLSKSLTYEHSLSVYAAERKQVRSSVPFEDSTALIVGDPVIVRTPQNVSTAGTGNALRTQRQWTYWFENGRPPALRYAGYEAREVGKLYGVQPLPRDKATEAAVRSRISTARLVHLAAHGYLDPHAAMSSGILLTPPERAQQDDTDNDGVLQAWEFGRLLPLQADVVVLSVCESGLGKTVRGEGLVGFTWSLQAAGARSVVATHWRIDDFASAQLMVSFHRKMQGPMAKDEALREAMAEIQGKSPTRHPYYWAAFFLTGDPEALRAGATR